MMSDDPEKLDQIRQILGDSDSPKNRFVKVEQTFLFGKILIKTKLIYLDRRDLWLGK